VTVGNKRKKICTSVWRIMKMNHNCRSVVLKRQEKEKTICKKREVAKKGI
jgi:hypothetical protein